MKSSRNLKIPLDKVSFELLDFAPWNIFPILSQDATKIERLYSSSCQENNSEQRACLSQMREERELVVALSVKFYWSFVLPGFGH
jgi:hypothetical protein